MMTTITSKGRPATKRNVVTYLGLAAILASLFGGVHVLYVGTDVAARDPASRDYEQGWSVVASSGEPGRFVASNYRQCVDARKTGYWMTDWWLTIVRSRENAASGCAIAVVSLAATAKGGAFSESVKDVIKRLPDRLARPDRPEHKLGWFVIDDRPS